MLGIKFWCGNGCHWIRRELFKTLYPIDAFEARNTGITYEMGHIVKIFPYRLGKLQDTGYRRQVQFVNLDLEIHPKVAHVVLVIGGQLLELSHVGI
jgi:hypothetical protein